MLHLKEGRYGLFSSWLSGCLSSWLSGLAHFGWELEREVDGKTPQLEGEPQLILITTQL